MKQIISKPKEPSAKNSVLYLHEKTQDWISEIEFIKIEQNFLKELISEHILGLCSSNNFQKSKLLLQGIEHEAKLGEELIKSLNKHNVNLSLVLENIYKNKSEDFRTRHEELKNEVKNYMENFKYLKEQVFELVLQIMKKEKQQRLLPK